MQHGIYFCFLLFLLSASTIQSGTSETTSTPGRRQKQIRSFPGKSFWGNLNRKKPFVPRSRNSVGNSDTNNNDKNESSEMMGQAVRVLKYDRAENERNAIPALNILDDRAAVNAASDGDTSDAVAAPLKWHRLDDGVMGGKSETLHSRLQDGSLHFTGRINTDGGGFCSIRSPLRLPKGTTAIRIRYRGDGKTYKVTLSDDARSRLGPSTASPSWQCDVPTENRQQQQPHTVEEEEITIPFSSLKPSFGPRPPTNEQTRKAVSFDADSIQQIGLMLSTKLSDGSNNPIETFGSGVFPFSFQVSSIEPIVGEGPE